MQCVGDYADLTEPVFLAGLASDGKCIGSSDAAAVCANDVTAAAQSCGVSCLTMGGDAATQDACTASCMAGKLTPTPSSDCLSCYVTDVACARAHCLVMCASAATGVACADCRNANGCTDGFYSCSGLPRPGGAASGGASG